jgi:hypothetical protein
MTSPIRNCIGYWIRSLKDEEFCAPQEVVGSLPPGVRRKLADYLDAGVVDAFNSQLGYSWCRFFCGATRDQMGSRELTDGVWIWPEGLSHYVREHDVILPEDFIAHALAEKRPSEFPHDPLHDFGPVSFDFWHDWCTSHRSSAFLQRLRSARAEADARASVFVREYLQRQISAEIERHGIGEERCMFAGCEDKVLSGMKLCARHVLREDTDHIAAGCYAITRELLA